MQVDTDKLIESMVAEGARKPLPHPVKQTIYWFGGTMVWLTVVSGYNGLRPDLTEKLANPLFMLELTLLSVMALAAAFAALCLSRPDAHQMPWVKYPPFAILALWAISTFAGTGQMTWPGLFEALANSSFDCVWHMLLLSVLPGIAMFLTIKKGAPIQCCWAGTMATWSVTAFAFLCIRVGEANDNLLHLMVWHALPILMMCMAGMMAGKYFLRWR